MYAGTLSYFAQLQAQSQLAALASKAKTGLLAAKGIFGYEPKVDYLFGLPRTISSGGIHLDIETTQVARSLDNDNQKTIDFIIQTSPIGSALEHQVPEQMFNTDPNNPTQGISTVKALQLANAQGQTIYKIDQTNIDAVLPKLNLSNDIKNDIQSSVNAGKYFITHTDNVSVPSWSGAGYAIIDPLSGSNAYMISGGSNGGFEFLSGLQNFLWIVVAAMLGGVDGYTSQSAGGSYMFADRLKYMAKMANISKFLGVVALIASSVQIMANDNLSNAQKAAQIALNVAVFMATNILLRALVFFAPAFAAILGVIIAGILATIGIYLASTYLSYLFRIKKRDRFVC